MYDYNTLEQITHVTVLPIPDPIIINCDMYRGETCRIDSVHGGVSYTTSRAEAFEIEYGRSTIRAKGLGVGSAKVYVKSRYGDYIKYIMEVNVLLEPPVVYSCEIPSGVECRTQWYDTADTYSITTTDPSVVDVSLYRYFQTFADGQRKMEKTIIQGLQPGTAEVYLYDNGDHRYTIQVTVGDPVPSLSLSRGSVTVEQGEEKSIEILSGGGEYRRDGYDRDIALVDIANDTDGLTGVIEIVGRNPGKTYPVVEDKYGQKRSFRVTVNDTKLILSHEEITLSNGNSEYISAREAHTGIASVVKSNTNISAQLKTLEDGERVIELKPLLNGETILEVKDYEGNTAWVRVVVGNSGGSNGGNEGDDSGDSSGGDTGSDDGLE
ncbi:hypothetical protein MK079_05470, partial [Candidatus Gracilibacteria bacterium]|nr:hypothetical protein [Candidatus Gracilibacteria bacterium]